MHVQPTFELSSPPYSHSVLVGSDRYTYSPCQAIIFNHSAAALVGTPCKCILDYSLYYSNCLLSLRLCLVLTETNALFNVNTQLLGYCKVWLARFTKKQVEYIALGRGGGNISWNVISSMPLRFQITYFGGDIFKTTQRYVNTRPISVFSTLQAPYYIADS